MKYFLLTVLLIVSTHAKANSVCYPWLERNASLWQSNNYSLEINSESKNKFNLTLQYEDTVIHIRNAKLSKNSTELKFDNYLENNIPLSPTLQLGCGPQSLHLTVDTDAHRLQIYLMPHDLPGRVRNLKIQIYEFENQKLKNLFTDTLVSAHNLMSERVPLPKSPPQTRVARNFIQSSALYLSNYAEEIRDAANQFSVPEALVRSVIHVESAFNSIARSSKDARGLMQLMAATARHYGVIDRYDVNQNINAGTKHLAYLINRYGNLKLALAAYNAGETQVNNYNGIPPFRETQNYVVKICDLIEQYKQHFPTDLSCEEPPRT